MNTAMNLTNEPEIKSILPFDSTRIGYWIENDSRDTDEKAVVMFQNGVSIGNISKLLNTTQDNILILILNYSKKIFNKKNTKVHVPILQKPDNYSEWNSKLIYKHWNQRRFKNQVT